MLEYKQSQIYKIYCKDTNIQDIYIGSTYNFKLRYYTHKNNCININNKKYNYRVYKFIRDNVVGKILKWKLCILLMY